MPPPVLRLSRSYHALCCALYTLVCIAWSQYAPQDLSSDQLTYHVYVAQAWWDGRLPHELLAASSQGYLNPLPHLPFWALFKADLPPRLIAALLAVLHSSNLWVLHGISGLLLASRGPTRMWLTPMAVLLGALTPMFAVETGSSLTDIIINLPSLFSVWAVLGWCQRCSQTNTPPLKLLWLGALAAGIATGLKPSAAFFSLTTAIAAMACSPLRLYPGMLWRMLAGGLVGFGISGGPHAWMLWHHFQNPVFPLFNRLFQAPLFPAIDLVSDRFRPASWQAGLDLLLNLHDPYVQTGFEGIAVDYRPAGLVLCAAVGLVWRLLQRQLRLTRVNGSFWLIILVFIPVWLYTSGNQRYALPAFMLLGPALALCLPGSALRLNAGLLACVLIAQGTAVTLLNSKRWGDTPWAAHWLDIDLPEQLQQTPAYYLSLQTQPYGILSALLAPGSRMTNLLGQHTLSPDGPGWQAVQGLKKAAGLPWRSLSEVSNIHKDGGVSIQHLAQQDHRLTPYGLQTERSTCVLINLNRSQLKNLHWTTETQGTMRSEPYQAALFSCELRPASPTAIQHDSDTGALDRKLQHWQERCPTLFTPNTTATRHISETTYTRFFANSETQLLATAKGVWLIHPNQSQTRLEDETGQALVSACPSPNRLKLAESP